MLKGSSIDSLVCISVTFSLWQLHSTTYACFNSFFFFFHPSNVHMFINHRVLPGK